MKNSENSAMQLIKKWGFQKNKIMVKGYKNDLS
jgi:hypothetical protein